MKYFLVYCLSFYVYCWNETYDKYTPAATLESFEEADQYIGYDDRDCYIVEN